MTDWYYHLPGQGRVGPLAADDVRDAYREGRVARDTLAWHAGVREWQPLDRFSEDLQLDSLNVEAAPSVPPPVAVRPAPASFDAGGTAAHERASPYAPPRAALAETFADYRPAADGDVVYAGFWRRVAALMIDSLVVTIAYYVVLLIGTVAFGVGAFTAMQGSSNPNMATFGALMAVIYLAYPVISGLYYVGFESSSTQATLGKMAVGIKVTDGQGRRLSRANALGRWASHLLCYVTVYIGYVMAAFTDRKRGLHDMVAGTLVVDRWAYTARPDRQQRGLGAVAIVVLVLGGLAMIAYVGIMLAVAIPAYQEYVRRAAGAA